ncbi:REM2- and Rab-like small GTPase 1 isoform X3 [Acanthaster planci]|uniref:Ciliogenesis and planar polarity effector 2 n=1 Tax=Acanthaster planci TaxID=133434 RepID=A0A8B7YF94_ACAPL|nr:REM2- and Rab-like small GTPase 1 isoform X3 [Acanthaster planci]XP_022090319.1 REM2- and Rab-like small GTPase 1 isoform X3 [Acanthaster planci]XP_022090321.1 REM2- and Rab-like small GTPase 1 isoform X3 [Acanthaster planci]
MSSTDHANLTCYSRPTSQFSSLERPSLPPHLIPELVSYKVFLSGKAGVGKTSTVAKLVGIPVPTTHSETPGIVTSTVYWPVKLLHPDKVLLFCLQFWDAGDNAIRKFEHILPACKRGADAILNLFSFTDRQSFEDLQSQMSHSARSGEHAIRMVVGTKYDLYSNSEITSRELQDFQEQWKVPILKIKNSSKPAGNELLYSVDNMQEVNEVAAVMNSLLEYIWTQKKISTGELRPEDIVTKTEVDGRDDRQSSEELEASYV